jgi:glycosyltransferase involved in cell wall biosynthesis
LETRQSLPCLDWQRKKWSWFARLVLKKGEWSDSRMPNQTVLVSNTLQKRFQSKYQRQYVYIPNGTELRERKLGPHLEQLGLTSNQYVLFLGRFSPEKNCDLLIDAFEQIHSPMKLVLAGGSAHTHEYTARLRSRENDRVKILQWLSGDALYEVLTNAALFVLSSDLEGLSLSLLEAMGAGICVLASDNPENREAIADCGFTFKAGDLDDLARMLCVLCDSPELREEYGHKGRLRVKEHYLWDEVVSKIEATYDELFTGPKAPRNHAAVVKSA